MSVTAVRSETFNRIAKARKIEEVLDWTVTDARVATESEWRHASRFAHVSAPSIETCAAVTALMDVRNGRHGERAMGFRKERIAYNTARRAALIVAAFEAVGLERDEKPTEEQWELAGRIARELAGVTGRSAKGEVSESVRDAVAALRA